MPFYEFEAKKLLAKHGVHLPRGGTAESPREAGRLAAEIGGSVVLKSQVLAVGRMKGGGVKFADTPEEAERKAAAILELEIGGQRPRCVLVHPEAAADLELAKKLVAVCPVNIFDLDGEGKARVMEDKEDECVLCVQAAPGHVRVVKLYEGEPG